MSPGPTYNEANMIQVYTAPYVDNIQVLVDRDLFTSYDVIDYYIIYVGQGVDCSRDHILISNKMI